MNTPPKNRIKLAYVVDSELPSQKANAIHALNMYTAFFEAGADVILYCRAVSEPDIVSFLAEHKNGLSVKYIIPSKSKHFFGINFIIEAIKQAKSVISISETDYVYARARLTPFFLLKFKPFIFEAHEWPNSFILRYIEKRILSSKNCKGLVVINDALKLKYLQEYIFLSQNKIHVLRDCANKVKSAPFPKAIDNNNSSRPECVIGYLGHLYPGKCMEIISKLARIRPKYLFHVVGGTPRWISYWKNELDKNKTNNVILYGYIDNRETGSWYSAFDIFLLPILDVIEVDGGKKRDIGKWTSPLKLFEAMSYGKAILASRVAPLQEVINEEADCLMADTGNIEDWGAQLDRLIEDKSLRNMLGETAKKKLEANYTWDIRAKKIMDIFSS